MFKISNCLESNNIINGWVTLTICGIFSAMFKNNICEVAQVVMIYKYI
jgi:hypothetical protein